MKDKRDECGCHRECFAGGELCARHPCTNPCRWPSCLTDDEHAELVVELQDPEFWEHL